MGRPAQGNAPAQKDDEFAEEAYQYTRSKTLQHEIKIEIEGVDKGGSFIGHVFTEDGTNIAVALVESGYAAVHKTAYNSPYYTVLNTAETRAKERNQNVSLKHLLLDKQNFTTKYYVYLKMNFSVGRTL